MKKIITIIGARPQFIKASVVSRQLEQKRKFQEIIIHTGQHFDSNMSTIFFDELKIPKPNYTLNIHGGFHGEMTGKMLAEIEKVLIKEKPDNVMVYGDTNSTLAGALAASKLHIPVIHIEAGLRSFNMHMPEEINRILTDNISSILFCPTDTAINNLHNEGFHSKPIIIKKSGDVMEDSALHFSKIAKKPIKLNLSNFILTTLHRAENTDDKVRLTEIVNSLNYIHKKICPIVFPLHPRTKNKLKEYDLKLDVYLIEPVGYLEMLWLLNNTNIVITDSGGLQKEAFFFKKPCITIRDQTEWVELIEAGVNKLSEANSSEIINSVKNSLNINITSISSMYGGGIAAETIANELESLL
ncbi:non-hydrolyzing UDP-N-acetylglucosamine 2-epimerase [Xenorhabdus griffiniae]|uniref:UDP-N-acetylglucosamine 2-epimerase (Non-hydrolyzing) n=1 Tax=Xenorhabdus griffiniae TaxID=351672 RepID=A0ABY9XHV6_9GAMM|nr:UDP-N-acetylglucosamine 2-epimerase (non-hydrolyzing) [Xenorhabdus griffiniae]MBD1227549.1 UDP-N-acetylglucosamine 2-epimerase (non-hydrolyzing) [Xenorhabdus griffiniae]MBE8589261.1 UDP-N-acetylglucosamine 2-epimerase (non-hydrolyzing) [Xenorhabdus griffiniae]WMV72416.1 UDP-N-acetylglucosamine 2-epimerase (non-hydrolyzing) [Xenorhabdus griffiniae]WNH02094.1 UDP-N-acetylglucosamine 2-epimerase (non-hydrolyzing) [Xenorhabdus griffiniae]